MSTAGQPNLQKFLNSNNSKAQATHQITSPTSLRTINSPHQDYNYQRSNNKNSNLSANYQSQTLFSNHSKSTSDLPLQSNNNVRRRNIIGQDLNIKSSKQQMIQVDEQNQESVASPFKSVQPNSLNQNNSKSNYHSNFITSQSTASLNTHNVKFTPLTSNHSNQSLFSGQIKSQRFNTDSFQLQANKGDHGELQQDSQNQGHLGSNKNNNSNIKSSISRHNDSQKQKNLAQSQSHKTGLSIGSGISYQSSVHKKSLNNLNYLSVNNRFSPPRLDQIKENLEYEGLEDQGKDLQKFQSQQQINHKLRQFVQVNAQTNLAKIKDVGREFSPLMLKMAYEYNPLQTSRVNNNIQNNSRNHQQSKTVYQSFSPFRDQQNHQQLKAQHTLEISDLKRQVADTEKRFVLLWEHLKDNRLQNKKYEDVLNINNSFVTPLQNSESRQFLNQKSKDLSDSYNTMQTQSNNLQSESNDILVTSQNYPLPTKSSADLLSSYFSKDKNQGCILQQYAYQMTSPYLEIEDEIFQMNQNKDEKVKVNPFTARKQLSKNFSVSSIRHNKQSNYQTISSFSPFQSQNDNQSLSKNSLSQSQSQFNILQPYEIFKDNNLAKVEVLTRPSDFSEKQKIHIRNGSDYPISGNDKYSFNEIENKKIHRKSLTRVLSQQFMNSLTNDTQSVKRKELQYQESFDRHFPEMAKDFLDVNSLSLKPKILPNLDYFIINFETWSNLLTHFKTDFEIQLYNYQINVIDLRENENCQQRHSSILEVPNELSYQQCEPIMNIIAQLSKRQSSIGSGTSSGRTNNSEQKPQEKLTNKNKEESLKRDIRFKKTMQII
eukprot:403376926